MATVTTLCQTCGAQEELAAEGVLVRVSEPVRDSCACCLFACRSCGTVTETSLGLADLALLLAAGAQVTVTRPAEPAREPAGEPAAPARPPLTRDDLLDLHELLATPDWFDQVVGAPRAS